MPATRFDTPGVHGLIRGEFHEAVNALETVVLCHGFKGFARWGFFLYIAGQLVAKGLNAITFDFSGSGIGPDRENFADADAFANNTFIHELTDLNSVLAHARASGWLPGRTGLFGHSRGGGVAILHTATDPAISTLVTWAAIGHVTRWQPEEVVEWRRRGYTEVTNSRTAEVYRIGTALLDEVDAHASTTLNIGAAAARVAVPWLIIHGTADDTVPSSEAEGLHRAAPSSSLALIEGASHSLDAKHPLTEPAPRLREAAERTVEFFVSKLAGRSD